MLATNRELPAYQIANVDKGKDTIAVPTLDVPHYAEAGADNSGLLNSLTIGRGSPLSVPTEDLTLASEENPTVRAQGVGPRRSASLVSQL